MILSFFRQAVPATAPADTSIAGEKYVHAILALRLGRIRHRRVDLGSRGGGLAGWKAPSQEPLARSSRQGMGTRTSLRVA